jgi:hypothetical protein
VGVIDGGGSGGKGEAMDSLRLGMLNARAVSFSFKDACRFRTEKAASCPGDVLPST